MTDINKILNIEGWSLNYVCEWLKGISSFSENYVKLFEQSQINGRKLSLLEQSDLSEMFKDAQESALINQVYIYKSIQNLIQMKYDLNKETLDGLVFQSQNRIVSVLNCIERIEQCRSCAELSCDKCKILKRNIVSYSSSLAATHRKLMSWLVRIPFTRLKPFEKFRDEFNNEMKSYLKLFRRKMNETLLKEIKAKLLIMLDICKTMIDYCDSKCDEENGKIAVAFSCRYLVKIVIRRRSPNQTLGLKLTSITDGIYTIAEILRESAADECSHLNVEDDIIAVNSQIVVGWSSENILKLLESSFSKSNSVSLYLRKMPKDHINSFKQQQKNHVFLYKNANRASKKLNQANKANNQQHQRKHSLSEIFIGDEFMMDDSSDEEEYNNDTSAKEGEASSKPDLICLLNNETGEKRRKFSTENLLEKENCASPTQKFLFTNLYMNKICKLAKNSSTHRLIRSMQNLFDRSRSNSADCLENSEEKAKKRQQHSQQQKQTSGETELVEQPKEERKRSIDESNSPRTAEQGLFKSLFTNKRWEMGQSSSKKNSSEVLNTEPIESPSNKKLETFKRANITKNSSSSSLNQESENKTVSSKPPLDKKPYKGQTTKPAMQGWLYKRNQASADSSSNSSINSTISSSNGSIGSKAASSKTNPIRSQIERIAKWKKFWCVLIKDYIAIYKTQDDKIPKDFLILKDFDLRDGRQKRSFVIVDKSKPALQAHEFYSENNEEYYEWIQAFTELRNRMIGELTSSSLVLSSSGLDTLGLINQSETSSITSSSLPSQSQSLPSSTTLSRKNNLQLNLATINDQTTDDQLAQLKHQNNSTLTSSNASPTLLSQHQQVISYGSSRESSPEKSSAKLASRDSSPGLVYAYQREQDADVTTSDSEAEIFSKTLVSENQEMFKELTGKTAGAQSLSTSNNNSTKTASNLSSSHIYSSSPSQPQLISFKKQMSSSPSPGSASSGQFVFDDTKPTSTDEQEDFHNVHNLINEHLDFSLSKPKQTSFGLKSQSPIHFAASLTANLLNTPNSPSTIYIQKPIVQPATARHQQQSHFNFFYQPHLEQNSPLVTPPSTSTRTISFQLCPNRITQINTFNLGASQLEITPQPTPPPPQQQQQQQIIVASMSKSNHHLRMAPISITTPSSPSVLYRTELTITPSNFTPNTPNTTASPNNPAHSSSSSSSSLPKYLTSNMDKRGQK